MESERKKCNDMVVNPKRDYKYVRICAESEEIFDGTTNNNNYEHDTSHLNVRDLIITKGKRKKRTWIIAGVVSAIVVALVVAAIFLLINEDDQHGQKSSESSLSLEDILYGRVNPITFNATWISGTELLYTDRDGNVVIRNMRNVNAEPQILIDATDPLVAGAFQFELSADEEYLLVAYGYQKIYRHSHKARYKIINLKTKERTDLTVADNQDLLLVLWAPVGNALAFVFDNNIYYKKSVQDQEIVAITNDTNFVYNGVPDWVYEEEIFNSNRAMWFSPDGQRLAFARFDDSKIFFLHLPIYGEPGSPIFQYPRANLIKYPKVGTPNPIVSLHSIDLNNPTNIKNLPAPNSVASRDPILSAVVWATNDVVTSIWLNRLQNWASIVAYSVKSEIQTSFVIKDLNEINGWFEFAQHFISADGTKLALLLSVDQGGDLGAYQHVVLLKIAERSETEPLTSGAYVVTEILGWDSITNRIFYLANTPEDSAVQHLYSVQVETKRSNCLTCDIKSTNGGICSYNIAEFSKNMSNYALTCAGPGVPEVSVRSSDGSFVLNWEDNQKLKELTQTKLIPTLRKLEFKVEGGFDARVLLSLPPNLDTSGNTKYPMLVNVYGGPNSFQVIDRFTLDWGSYLAANKSIIYATIDGRGSGLKGDKMLHAIYRKMGSVEIADQINVTKQIQQTLNFVDSKRTAIWGWSYGGFASGMILAEDTKGVFKCGISVAPVTDWTLYDSIYTERFMGLATPNDNYQGYRDANLLFKYEGLRDKPYFLIHGTYDDNVHYQQSMLWAKVLERHDILFRQLSYPDEDHSLSSVRPHFYHSIEEFLDECFEVEFKS